MEPTATPGPMGLVPRRHRFRTGTERKGYVLLWISLGTLTVIYKGSAGREFGGAPDPNEISPNEGKAVWMEKRGLDSWKVRKK